jgi:hypothetical protein
MALLADTLHNFGDAFTALPLWIAFHLTYRSSEQLRRKVSSNRNSRTRARRPGPPHTSARYIAKQTKIHNIPLPRKANAPARYIFRGWTAKKGRILCAFSLKSQRNKIFSNLILNITSRKTFTDIR